MACPVCFGQSDSPMASAVTLGIFAMLAVTVGVLSAFATFFIYLMRRARAVRLAEGLVPPVVARATNAESNAQEGTASC